MLTAVARTRLEKAAVDNGFDLDLGSSRTYPFTGVVSAVPRRYANRAGSGEEAL